MGWETAPFMREKMETVKLTNKDAKIIERLKTQYELNTSIWENKGWTLYKEKSKVDLKPKQEKPKEKVEVKAPYSIPKDTPVEKKDK